MILGTTFSHRQVEYLELNTDEAFECLLDLKLDVVRLCCYWNEIEKEPGVFDLGLMEKLLKRCEEKGQKVVVTVGMKAPRAPEFYSPKWLDRRDLEKSVWKFIEACVKRLQEFKCIEKWQVENEPLDPVWPEKKVVETGVLKREVEIVRGLDKRKILVNMWGNNLLKKADRNVVAELADVVGIDLYYSQFIVKKFGRSFYKGPNDTDRQLSTLIMELEKPVWLVELQAEPWEDGHEKYLLGDTRSMTPQKLKTNFERARKLPVEAVLFWGYEYWFWRLKQGDGRYMEVVKKIKAG